MSFRYEKAKAIDDARNVAIWLYVRHGARRGPALQYIFEQGRVRFEFDAVFVSGMIDGRRVTLRAGIDENKFRVGLAKARNRALLPPCDDEDFQSYKEIAIEGMIEEITRGGKFLSFAPAPIVEFIADQNEYLMKYAGDVGRSLT